MKLSSIRYLNKQGLENIWKNRMMAFASFCVLLVSILLVGIAVLIFMNLNSIISAVGDKNEVIVFLDPELGEDQIGNTPEVTEPATTNKPDADAEDSQAEPEEGEDGQAGSEEDEDGQAGSEENEDGQNDDNQEPAEQNEEGTTEPMTTEAVPEVTAQNSISKTKEDLINAVRVRLEQIDNIGEIVFYSKDDALKEMKNNMDGYDNVFDSLVDDNPLPDSFRLRIKDIALTSETVNLIKKIDNVYSVRAPYDFVNILSELKKIVSWVSIAVIIALAIVSMVIISNTTKASVFARRNEISIMKYVGATDMFIRIPFFIEGMVTGFAAGIAATIITWIGYDALVDLLTNEMNLLNVIGRNSVIPFGKVAIWVAVIYVLAGGLIGALGSVVSTRKHLDV